MLSSVVDVVVEGVVVEGDGNKSKSFNVISPSFVSGPACLFLNWSM